MTADDVHRLGMAISAMAAVVCVAGAVCGARREQVARQRLALLVGTESARRSGENRWAALRDRFTGLGGVAASLRGWLPPLGAGLGGFVLIGGVPGCLVGCAAAYGIRKWRQGPREGAQGPGLGVDTEAVARQLPLAADLLAACLAAGVGPREAAEAVGSALGGPVGDRLTRVAAELRLGAEAAAWGRLGELPGAEGLVRCLGQAQVAGTPVVEQVTRLAAEFRAERAREAAARARRAGVLATAPLGLCFLPAFLAVGLAPVLIGLASRLLNGG